MLTFILSLFSVLVLAQTNCDDLFENRGINLSKAQEALNCYENSRSQSSNRLSLAHDLNQISYLKFFIAEVFLDLKTRTLLEGINIAEESILLFGKKYSLNDYKDLSEEELKLLATAFYNYGLTTARYIDLMGTMEALKRMDDIKKSMATIFRLKQESVAHYGAHRTMGIFHTKVPGIAGGQISQAKTLLTTAIDNTIYANGVSTYPANNIAYSDYLYKQKQFSESCHQLRIVSLLTEDDIRKMNNNLFYESMIDIQNAKDLMVKRKCSP